MPTAVASASGMAVEPTPLSRIALSKSPLAEGMTSRQAMLMAPADSPNTVTFRGSPPKAAIWSRTQRNAAAWSSRPSLPVAGILPPVTSLRFKKPSTFKR